MFPHGRELEPRPYDGASSWKNYYRYFTSVSERNGWSDAQKGLALACGMKDRALEVLCELEEGEDRDFRTIVDHFNDRFNIEYSASYYKDMFDKARSMSETESAADYGHVLMDL